MKKVLRCAVFNLSREWGQEEYALRVRLAREGILCVDFTKTEWSLIKRNEDTVVLTDSPQTGAKLAREGIVYVGCCHAMDTRINQNSATKATDADMVSCWFDGAALVLEGFEEVDARYLEEWMLRAKGHPVTIARTKRLLIREISDKDIPELERIGRTCGGAEAKEEPIEETNVKMNEGISYAGENICKERELHVQGNRFTKEYLYPYRRTAYRLQGFGLWSVLYRDRVIGCCGFEPWDEKLETAESDAQSPAGMRPDRTDKIMQYHLTLREVSAESLGIILEMQYMLDPAYHRQGFGTEMCRASLACARERLDADEVRLRIREGNLASRALAEKLGFVSEL
ncbi:MAG: GNAT family N-acetyltransferase [Lachnospiraceae bacterium]|nr:GNAT family N-acetyltransferase [Lachnospiraceae bacterium]